jgi:hypothetical protein
LGAAAAAFLARGFGAAGGATAAAGFAATSRFAVGFGFVAARGFAAAFGVASAFGVAALGLTPRGFAGAADVAALALGFATLAVSTTGASDLVLAGAFFRTGRAAFAAGVFTKRSSDRALHSPGLWRCLLREARSPDDGRRLVLALAGFASWLSIS